MNSHYNLQTNCLNSKKFNAQFTPDRKRKLTKISNMSYILEDVSEMQGPVEEIWETSSSDISLELSSDKEFLDEDLGLVEQNQEHHFREIALNTK